MSITSSYNYLQDASEKLDYARANGVSADFSTGSGELVESLVNESLEPLALHVQECNFALDAVNVAMEEVGGMRPLGSLRLQEIRDATDSAKIAEQKFTAATDLVKAAITNSKGIPELLRPASARLSTYLSDGTRSLQDAQTEEKFIEEAKGLIAQALPADHEVSQWAAGLHDKASTMTKMTGEAGEQIKGDVEEGAEAGPRQLQDLVENMQVSLVLLGSALDKPLDQFAALLREAASKVNAEDIAYLKDLSDRLKQSINTHNAAADLREEIRLSIFKIEDGIEKTRRVL